MPGGYPSFNPFIHLPIPSILPTICPPSIHPFTHPSRLFNYPFIYPPTHHSIYLPTIFSSSTHPSVFPHHPSILLYTYPSIFFPSLIPPPANALNRSGVGVGRDLEQWKNVPPRATPILQQETGRASITYQGVEHSVLKAAEIQKFLRRVASGVICILASTFPWKAEGMAK